MLLRRHCIRSPMIYSEGGCTLTLFSSSITVSEAIPAANNLKAELKFTELETNFENTQTSMVFIYVYWCLTRIHVGCH